MAGSYSIKQIYHEKKVKHSYKYEGIFYTLNLHE